MFLFDKDVHCSYINVILVFFLSIWYRTQIQLGHDISRMGLNIDFQFLLRVPCYSYHLDEYTGASRAFPVGIGLYGPFFRKQ